MQLGRTTVHEKEYNNNRTSNCQRPRFHWCSEPEEETGLGCLQAPLSVATSKRLLGGQHVEKNLESLASSLEVRIFGSLNRSSQEARHGRVVRRLSRRRSSLPT